MVAKQISLLLHTCCAHCTAYPADYWQSQGFQVTLFWYNPNIHPLKEHERRLEAVKTLSQVKNLNLIAERQYDFVEFFRQIVGHEAERCPKCFQIRLRKTVETALDKNFSTFSTTLLISPHQKHEFIRKAGEEVARESKLTFLYYDLRRNYSESRRQTKGLNLYRQQYCGCLYSEWERYSESESK